MAVAERVAAERGENLGDSVSSLDILVFNLSSLSWDFIGNSLLFAGSSFLRLVIKLGLRE